ncbi:MAG: Gfo/Idh/MocA family oxidoreductase [Mycobacteriales bacterium]
MTTASARQPVRLGVVGLGAAGAAVLPFAERHPEIVIVAGADPDAAARSRFASTGPAAFGTVDELVRCPDVEAVYVASPTELHPEHVRLALTGGKHVVVEKPMAPSLAAAEAMVNQAREADRLILVGHSQSFEAPVRAIRAVVESGVLGALTSINCWYFTDWMYRPRHPDELDMSKGGGVPFRQAAHHMDIVRYLGGGMLVGLRGRTGCWDRSRRADGAYTAYLEFEDGTPATAVYSGYDHFPSHELTFGLGETGQPMGTEYAVARRRLDGLDADGELALKRGAGGASRQAEILSGGEHQPFFGLVLVSCERGDLRVAPDGLLVYGDASREQIPLTDLPVGRHALLTELVDAVRGTAPATHDGAWGLANLEVCEALLTSSAKRQEVALTLQVPLPPQPELPQVVAHAARAAGARPLTPTIPERG